MIPDAGGVRDTFDEMAAKLAGFGYAVLLPDVYYREGDWAPFDMATVFGDADERARIMFMMGTLTPDRITRDAEALFDYLAGRPEVTGERFGVCGYCMGGRISVLLAGRLPQRVAAAASFHGGGLVSDNEDSPHLLADRMNAVIYVGGAENDPSFTADHAEQPGSTDRGRGPAHHRVVPGRARVRGARQCALRRRGRRAALGGDGGDVRLGAALSVTYRD